MNQSTLISGAAYLKYHLHYTTNMHMRIL